MPMVVTQDAISWNNSGSYKKDRDGSEMTFKLLESVMLLRSKAIKDKRNDDGLS